MKGIVERARAVRLPMIISAAVFAGLWTGGALALPYALAGFGLVALAMLLPRAGVAATPIEAPVTGPALSNDADAQASAVLMALPDPVIALGPNDEVVAFNTAAAAIAPALRRGEPLSLGVRNPEILAALRQARTQGAQSVEFVQRVPVDRRFEAIVMPATRVEAPARVDRMLITFRDLTPLRRVEEMRADFVANASHELRTPLAALSGFIETLQGPARDDAAARERFLTIMSTQAGRMTCLIEDLLSLSRVELNAHRRPEGEVDLPGIVRQVIDGLQMLARERGVDVKVTVPPELPRVRGDRDELLRVFENLLENALKYGASGSRVDVALTTDGQGNGAAPEVCVAVRDYGPGIAPEHLPRLTERFYRVDVAESRAQGGTGLGLALAKHIINRHGGRLTIESMPGQGATFTAHLPVARPGGNSQLSTAT